MKKETLKLFSRDELETLTVRMQRTARKSADEVRELRVIEKRHDDLRALVDAQRRIVELESEVGEREDDVECLYSLGVDAIFSEAKKLQLLIMVTERKPEVADVDADEMRELIGLLRTELDGDDVGEAERLAMFWIKRLPEMT